MSYNVKNYTEQGGDVTHIGGKLVIEEGAELEGAIVMEAQEDSTADTVAKIKTDFNSLLEKLRAAGLMATSD